jgi:hypothetical protein
MITKDIISMFLWVDRSRSDYIVSGKLTPLSLLTIRNDEGEETM